MKELNDISINILSSSTKEIRYLVSSNTNYFETNALTAELLTSLKEANNKNDGIKNFITKNHKYSFEQINELIETIILPNIKTIEKKPAPFLYQRNLLNKEQISKITGSLSILFNKYFMIFTMFIFMILDIFFFTINKDLVTFNEQTGVLSFIVMLFLVIISSAFHELGHASACKFCGAEHGGIGIGLYINFPVLYTDVTNIWKLSRKKRCLVNFAGVYFQCIILIPLILSYEITHYFLIRYLILIINFGFLLTLNPFFKFDGYWMVSDILGVTNLRERSKETIKYIIQNITHRHYTLKRPYLFRLKPIAKFGFILYAITVNLFLSFYLFYIIPLFVCKFADRFPEEIYKLIMYFSVGAMPPLALLHSIFSQAIFFIIIVYMLLRLAKPFLGRYNKRNSTNEDSQA